MLVAGDRSQIVASQPELPVRWFNFAHLRVGTRRPVPLDPAHDMRLALQSLGLLVLDRFKIAVAKLRESKFAFRTIDLALFVFERGQPPLG